LEFRILVVAWQSVNYTANYTTMLKTLLKFAHPRMGQTLMSICLCFSFSSIVFSQEEKSNTDEKLLERRVRHQEIQKEKSLSENSEVSLSEKINLFHSRVKNILNEIPGATKKNEDFENLYKDKIEALCPSYQLVKSYNSDVLSVWISNNETEAKGYLSILDALIFYLENDSSVER